MKDFGIIRLPSMRKISIMGRSRLRPGILSPTITLHSFEEGLIDLEQVEFNEAKFTGTFELWDMPFKLSGQFEGDELKGTVATEEATYPFVAKKVSDDLKFDELPEINYILSATDLPDSESNIDHAGIIEQLSVESFERGKRIYNGNCINCHGNPEIDGSIPLSHKFWEQPFKAGQDPYSMYLTLTKGYGSMPPQLTLTPQEKYDVICFIREAYIRPDNASQYFSPGPNYLASLPKGNSRGPAAKPYHPWSDMDYGNFFINTYELVDEATGPARYHSPGPAPFPDEDYLKNNFAYKGIAIRLDRGEGGVSQGKAWLIFDHDLMRVAGAWTGEGFIDWAGILLNDEHETYPRTIGKLHFENPVAPGWANPTNGSFVDPRFKARDGRQFGPLPKQWADFKGIYQDGDHIVVSYKIGEAKVLEEFGIEQPIEAAVFTRTLNVSGGATPLNMRIAPITAQVEMLGEGASLAEQDGFHVLKVAPSATAKVKLFIAHPDFGTRDFKEFTQSRVPPATLSAHTKGGAPKFAQVFETPITQQPGNGPFSMDILEPPFDNPWNCRMKLSGIDFMADPDQAGVVYDRRRCLASYRLN